ncbi:MULTISPECIES: DUF2491 family protein [Pseudomonas]|jgi:hypothetical protein|uniref:DUF2491 family protein n=1 Tax=Pseudomonas gingeri TaxID=117681 RepID=A0A7Y7WHS2_9PSED|nr:DUF2491 family protein [Pseudomonas gingeri]NWB48714.1 DUF2491 family protein [Pseudomonas gingeri]
MSWIKRVMGFEAPKPAAGATSVAPGSPLGLASGRMLCLDRSLKLLLEGQSHVVLPDDEKVWAVGDIDLGQSMRLQRFYLDNEDYFLQVVMNGPAAEDIQDLILFGYHDVTTINSKEQLLQLTGPNAKIGMPLYELEGEEYGRQWGSEDGQTELTPMQEFVKSPDGAYSIKHLSMLYSREIGLLNRREFLLFSVEEDEEGVITLSTAVGVTLQITDIEVL